MHSNLDCISERTKLCIGCDEVVCADCHVCPGADTVDEELFDNNVELLDADENDGSEENEYVLEEEEENEYVLEEEEENEYVEEDELDLFEDIAFKVQDSLPSLIGCEKCGQNQYFSCECGNIHCQTCSGGVCPESLNILDLHLPDQPEKEDEQPSRKRALSSTEEQEQKTPIFEFDVQAIDLESSGVHVVTRRTPSKIKKEIRVFGLGTWNVAHFGATPKSLVTQAAELAKQVGTYRASIRAMKLLKWKNLSEKESNELEEELGRYQEDAQELEAYIAQLAVKLGTRAPIIPDDLRSIKKFSAEQRVTRARSVISVIRKGIGELQAKLDKKSEDLDKEHHKAKVSDHIAGIFNKNLWLDALVLQEVGAGQERLAQDLEAAGLELRPGPEMISFGGEETQAPQNVNAEVVEEQPKGRRGKKRARKKPAKPPKPKGQHEYYPIVLRKGSRKVTYVGWRTISTDGTIASDQEAKPPVRWNKSLGSYRPVVVHDLKVGNLAIHVGVIHTSPGTLAGQPGDKEFQRPNEFAQVREAFKHAKSGYWIFAGDYYLSREARVLDLKRLLEEDDGNFASDVDVTFDLLLYEFQKRDPDGRPYKKLDDNRKGTTAEKYKAIVAALKDGRSLKTAIVATSQADLVRTDLKLTFQQNLPDNLRIEQTVSGTNWHGRILKGSIPPPLTKEEKDTKDPPKKLENEVKEKERAEYFAVARIADILVYTDTWSYVRSGIFHPAGKVVAVDAADLRHSKYWYDIADHFPVAARFSLDKDDPLVDAIFVQAKDAVAQAEALQKRRLRLRLQYLAGKVDDQKALDPLDAFDDDLTRVRYLEDCLSLPESERTEVAEIDPRDFEPESTP